MKFTMTRDSITAIHEGKTYTIAKGAPNWANLSAAIGTALRIEGNHPHRQDLVDEAWSQAAKHLTITKSLAAWCEGTPFKVVQGVAGFIPMLEGERLPRAIEDKIVTLSAQGKDPTPLLKFYERLSKNPSMRSVQQLFPFLEHEGIPIEENGTFLAYKSVKSDYTDHHTGTVDNKPGVINEMPRNKISDDPNEACHYGFHVGALSYAQGQYSSGHIIICRVDPEHVVCVPYDSSQRKMRVCKYEVVGEWSGHTMPNHFVPKDFTPSADELDEDDEDEGSSFDSDNYEEEGEITVSPDPVGSNEVKVSSQAKKKRPTKNMNKMDMRKLMEQSIEDLRRYAGHSLKIVGASKIPGGKTALVSTILKIRRRK